MNKEEILKRKLEVSRILFANDVPVDKAKMIGSFIEDLEQENQQLKEKNSIIYCQLEEMQMNKTDYTEVNMLEMKLQQRDEVIDKMINLIKWLKDCKNVSTIQGCEVFYQEDILSKIRDLEELLDILNKGRESHD